MDKEEQFSVAKRLIMIRDCLGLSQRELARRAGMTNSTLSMIEQGKVSPSIASLEKVLQAVSVSLSDFFADDFPMLSPVVRGNDLPRHSLDGVERIVVALPKPIAEKCAFTIFVFPVGASIDSEGVDAGSVDSVGIMHSAGRAIFRSSAGLLMAGEMAFRVDGVAYKLRSGDNVNCTWQRTYSLTNTGEGPAVLVALLF